ncbi:ArsR/SmtB family transcription factor [Paeniglutamicibacter psychrophenolicus]|uniref:DNA-binding transcriptional ArsR family regulator n=1 Tax=Paeniglutamicibacter psychrophenolicus TaxID=257454 RepID=A0ABS4WH00_9MICC|nr:metalloregulator ArsR/SmtB family transcription factor [Paeniglutamicibacter psychrophenolicus]MBP2375486.1 DNA-binding transcriptional ArsR family regulator [Paeniglutamicibacter psychrophenolicus]
MNGLPGAESTQPIFAALSDETRRQVLALLGEKAASASRLSAPLGISRQAVAKHLRILVEAGLAHRRREGREVVFELVVDGLGPAIGYINALGSGAGGPDSSASDSR